jgi:IMP dehydrogenase/GMP reductase
MDSGLEKRFQKEGLTFDDVLLIPAESDGYAPGAELDVFLYD